MDFKPGDILRIAGHVGIVKAVYRCDGAPPVLKVDFVKNAVRQVGAELVDLDVIPTHAIKEATIGDLIDEWESLYQTQENYVIDLIGHAGEVDKCHKRLN
jgi:hypothetical protein